MMRFILGLVLTWGALDSVEGFVAKSGLSPSPRKFVATAPNNNGIASIIPFLPRLSEEGSRSTSLHVGVASYEPPNVNTQLGATIATSQQRYNNPSDYQFFDVDPAFSALSIAYPANTEAQEEQQSLRTATKALAGATALICAALLAQRIPTLLGHLPHLYRTFPLRASIATCSVNSMVADTIAQVQLGAKEDGGILSNFEWKQTLSSMTYGALCLGIGSNLVYTKLLPALFPGGGVRAILSQACMDNFLFAPLLWLPPAYMIKAAFLQQPIMGGLKQYVQAVRKEKLLVRYWCMWLPAQTFTFSVVPKHLRVLSTAAFSFVWFLILTSMTSKKSSPAAAAASS